MSFIYEKPLAPALPTFGGGQATFGELWNSSRDLAVYADNFNADESALEEAYDRRIDRIMTATGIAVKNPLRQPTAAPRGAGTSAGQIKTRGQWMADFDRHISALVKQHPEARDAISPGMPVAEEAKAIARQAEAAFGRDVASRTDFAGKWAAAIGGGFAGGLRDPVQVATLLAGGGPGAARTIAGRVLTVAVKEMVINGAVEAAMQPKVQAWREKAGLEAGFVEGARNTVFAAAAGGLFGIGGQMVEELGRALFKGRLLDSAAALAAEGLDPASPMARTLKGAPEDSQIDLNGIREALPPEARGALDARAADNLAAGVPPTRAAILFRGKLYEADLHADALEKLRRSFGYSKEVDAEIEELPEGAFGYSMGGAYGRTAAGAQVKFELNAKYGPEEVLLSDALRFAEDPDANPINLGELRRELAQEMGPRPSGRQPVSLLTFLAREGGLAEAGDLTAMDAGRWFGQGGRLVRKEGGLSLDEARRRAVEAGYLRETGFEGGVAVSTVDDLTDAIAAELAGQKVFSRLDADADVVKQLQRQHDDSVALIDQVIGKLEGVMSDDLSPQLKRRAADIMLADETADPEIALERAVMEDYYGGEPERALTYDDGEAIPFETTPFETDDGARGADQRDDAARIGGGADRRPEGSLDPDGGQSGDFGEAQSRPAEPAGGVDDPLSAEEAAFTDEMLKELDPDGELADSLAEAKALKAEADELGDLALFLTHCKAGA